MFTESFIRRFFAVMLVTAVVCSLNFCEAAKKTVAVMPLQNVSGYGDNRVAEIMTEQLLVAIHSSGTYSVVEQTQIGSVIQRQGFENIAGDPSTATEMGKLIGADYILVGKVTMAVVENNPTSSAIGQIGNLLGLDQLTSQAGQFIDKYKGKIEMELRFVDAKTGEIILAKTITGSKSGSSQVTSINSACKDVAEKFLKELDDVNPFRARVAEISGENIYIDCGSEGGLRRGETLIVAREGKPIMVNGRIVDMQHLEIGKVKVKEIYADYAICKAEKNGANIRKGDVVKRR